MANCKICSKPVVDGFNPYPGCYYFRDTCEICNEAVCNSKECSMTSIDNSDSQRKICIPCCEKFDITREMDLKRCDYVNDIVCFHKRIDRKEACGGCGKVITKQNVGEFTFCKYCDKLHCNSCMVDVESYNHIRREFSDSVSICRSCKKVYDALRSNFSKSTKACKICKNEYPITRLDKKEGVMYCQNCGLMICQNCLVYSKVDEVLRCQSCSKSFGIGLFLKKISAVIQNRIGGGI